MPRDFQALAAKQAAFRADPTDPRHGTPNGYRMLGCRCERCQAAQAEAMALYRASRR